MISWTEESVVEWLHAIELSSFADSFRESLINGVMLIEIPKSEELLQMIVPDKLLQFRILAEIELLTNEIEPSR